MAAERYSSEVLRTFYGPINISLPPSLAEESTISEAIQNLPRELREIIYKEYLAIKMRQRAAMGWDEVHQAIEGAHFCEDRAQIVKVLFCHKCDTCGRNGLCYVCNKNGVKHYLGYPVFDVDDYDEIFQKFY